MRRRRGVERHRLHAACVGIVDASVTHARTAARTGPERDRPIWMARLRKLETLAAWMAATE